MLTLCAEDPRLLDRLRAWPGVIAMRNDPSGARVELDDMDRVPDIVAALAADGVRITRVEPHKPSLEDLYFLIRGQLGDRARAEGREVANTLDPVAPEIPRAPVGPNTTMPTIEVPDTLGRPGANVENPERLP